MRRFITKIIVFVLLSAVVNSSYSTASAASLVTCLPVGFNEQALAEAALSAHRSLFQNSGPRTWETLKRSWTVTGRRVWVAQRKSRSYLIHFLRAPTHRVLTGELGGPFAGSAPEFFKVKQTRNSSLERALVKNEWVYRLTDRITGSSILISPHLGNDVFSFKPIVQGKPQEIFAYHGFHIGQGSMPILFPFANRVGNMEVESQGKRLTLKGEKWVLEWEGHAIHGVVNRAPWKTAVMTKGNNIGFRGTIEIDQCFDGKEIREFFGHASLSVAYLLYGNTLHVYPKIHNRSDHPASYIFALHPYFKISAEPADREHIRVTAPADSVWINNERNLPKNQLPVPVPEDLDLRDGISLGAKKFDHVYTGLDRYRDSDGWWTALLQDFLNRFQVAVGLDRHFEQFVFYVDGESAAMEGQSSATNAFALQSEPEVAKAASLMTIGPQQSWSAHFRITVKDLPKYEANSHSHPEIGGEPVRHYEPSYRSTGHLPRISKPERLSPGETLQMIGSRLQHRFANVMNRLLRPFFASILEEITQLVNGNPLSAASNSGERSISKIFAAA